MLFLKNLLFTLLIPGTVAVYIPLSIVGDTPPASIVAMLTASILFLLGGAIYAWCVWDFATFGGGTPAPIDAPKQLVVRGLYRYTRNPMYVGVLTVIGGWCVYYGSLRLALYALFVWSLFQSFIVFYEEPHLRRVFGVAYERYRATVPRWLRRPAPTRE